MTPYQYVTNNPIRYIDPTGMSQDDWVEKKNGDIYWDNNATSQKTTKSGEIWRGKSYERVKDWDNVKDGNGNIVSGTVLESYNSNKKMSYSPQVGLEINISGEATKTGRKDKIGRDAYFAEGNMQVNGVFANGKTAELQNVKINSGPFDYGPTPNGEYLASGIVNVTESGMVRDGVGFKVLLNNNTELNRTGLRIHPDQNPSLGTAGCIGICENATELKTFRNIVRGYFDNNSTPFKVNINFRNNPNYNRLKGGKSTSGQ